MKHVERLLAHLGEVAQTETGWQASCPYQKHGDDRTQRLSISTSEEDQRIRLNCAGGCPQDAILEEMGLAGTDLCPQPGDLDDDGHVKEASSQPAESDAVLGHEVYTPRDGSPCVVEQAPEHQATTERSEPTEALAGPEKFPYGAGDPVPFPLGFFPEPLQEVVHEISTAVNSPPDLVACAMVSAAATAIGRSRQLEPMQDWRISPRLYMGLVCDPGSGKTPVLTKVMQPLWRKNSEWEQDYAQARENYKAEEIVFEARKQEFTRCVAKNMKQGHDPCRRQDPENDLATDAPTPPTGTRRTGWVGSKQCAAKTFVVPAAVQDQQVEMPVVAAVPAHVEATLAPMTALAPDDAILAEAPVKPVPPVLRQVVTNDVTTEKLAVIMGNNPRGIIRLTDELAAFIYSMNLYHNGHGADRQFYLSSWSGSTAQVDRKSLDRPILVREPFVNVLGGIQPDMLGALEDKRGREDGFMHRFLFTFPMPTGRRTWNASSGVSPRIRQVWAAVIDWLFDLTLQEPEDAESGSEPQPRTLRLTPEAEAVWVQWHQAHWDESEWACFPPHLRGVWNKFEVHALALVLVAHMLKIACEHALTSEQYTNDDPMIDEESMRRGLQLADYFKDHNIRVFNRLKVSNEDLRAQRVIAWIRKRPGKQTTARQLHQNNVAGIKVTSAARTILKDLEDRGWGKMMLPPGKGSGKDGYFQAE